VQAGRTPEKCVLLPFFENLFLGALLAFLCSIFMRRKKQHFMFAEERKEGKKDM
jgi:hypothetical protein